MTLVAEYRDARRGEAVARLRRVIALRAMLATGMSQRAVAEALGVTQPAVSQQANADIAVDAETLVEAAAPVLKDIAAERGFTDLAVFGSVARQQSRADSDIDLLIRPPEGATIADLLALQDVYVRILGRAVDVVSYEGLRADRDEDVLRDAVPL